MPDAAFCTVAPGLGNSRSIDSGVVQVLMPAKFATKRSGKEPSRLFRAWSISIDSLADLLELPALTKIGEQFW